MRAALHILVDAKRCQLYFVCCVLALKHSTLVLFGLLLLAPFSLSLLLLLLDQLLLLPLLVCMYASGLFLASARQ